MAHHSLFRFRGNKKNKKRSVENSKLKISHQLIKTDGKERYLMSVDETIKS